MTVRVSEKVVQAHIVRLLKTVGATVYVLGHPSPNDGRAHRGTGQTPGVPDLLGFLPPKKRDDINGEFGTGWLFLFVECKAAGGRLRPEQRRFREECLSAGVAHIVGDVDAVIAFLLERGYLSAGQVPHYRLPADRQEAHA